jgi:hypothetical protein
VNSGLMTFFFFVVGLDLASLAIIAALLAGGVVASLAAARLDPPHPTEEAARRPPRCPSQLTPPPANGSK